MQIAARQSFLTGRAGPTPWQNPYITDGLVAMWDGEWNAGGGVHDATATTWRDIVRGVNAQYSIGNETPAWGDKYWRSTSSTDGRYFQTTLPALDGASSTIEVVFVKSANTRGMLVGCNLSGTGLSGNNFAVEYHSSNRRIRFYYNNNPDLTLYNSVTIGTKHYYAGVRTETAYSLTNGVSGVATATGTFDFTETIARIGADCRVSQFCWNGYIYSLRFYSRALTAAEVAANYAIDAARFGL